LISIAGLLIRKKKDAVVWAFLLPFTIQRRIDCRGEPSAARRALFEMIDLPQPRPVLWPLRSRGTARIEDDRLPDGRRRITIHHADLSGVSPAMLDWRYHNIEGTMEYAGSRWPRYCVWHPLDHIFYSVTKRIDGKVGPGARLHIREAFQRKPENLLDLRVEVESIDSAAAIIRKKIAGVTVLRLVNRFEAAVNGT
jgi:hypothetical protein